MALLHFIRNDTYFLFNEHLYKFQFFELNNRTFKCNGIKILLHFSICKKLFKMKQTTLVDLYYGNINPNEISFVRGSQLGKCNDKSKYTCFLKK